MYKVLKSVIVAVVIVAATGAHAMFARMSDQQLIDASEVIVVGTLTRFVTAPDPADGENRTFGLVEVHQALKGQADGTLMLAVPQPGGPVSSSDIYYRKSDKGLWFLRRVSQKGQTGTPVFAADNPQRFVPMGEAAPGIAAVRKAMQP